MTATIVEMMNIRAYHMEVRQLIIRHNQHIESIDSIIECFFNAA